MRSLHDAEHRGDQELQQFFQEVQECQRHLATRAKEMLKQRLSRGNGQGASMGQSPHAHQGAGGSMAGAGTGSQGSTENQGRNNR